MNSIEFYLDEDSGETNSIAPVDNNEADEDPAEANVAPSGGNDNNKVVGKEGEDEIPIDYEGVNTIL
ncbi:hypothetical protein J1N35_041349 [Gossypium stocksii]|uniref:Uncharacterized protein n=1 Tax=Gossypium stocksii TaxID=47602 RepID=A0A9D3UFC3_9ROSI|nr:hypothetical protein J1N35_041349 [Gossypium stocksii]